jgi:hypothetical protein
LGGIGTIAFVAQRQRRLIQKQLSGGSNPFEGMAVSDMIGRRWLGVLNYIAAVCKTFKPLPPHGTLLLGLDDYQTAFARNLIGIWSDWLSAPPPAVEALEFYADGNGKSVGNGVTIHFEWREVSTRCIEVRCLDGYVELVEYASIGADWQLVQYDFAVVEVGRSDVVVLEFGEGPRQDRRYYSYLAMR